MSSFLVKAPGESRTYTFDFTGALPPGPRHGDVWSEVLLGEGLVLSSPMVSAARDDGIASDLTLGTPTTDGQTVTVTIGGGTSGHTYRVTCAAASGAQALIMQGLLSVSGALP